MNPMHEKNRQKWQVTASRWKARRDVAARWRTCAEDSLFGFEDRQKYLLRKHIGNLRGKRVCVLGSGDNYAARQVLHHCEYFHDEKDAEDKIRMEYHYFDHTPKEYLYNPETGKGYALVSDVSLEERKGKPTQFNFHWTVSDFVTALIETGFDLVEFFEKPAAHPENWRENMLDGLPQGLRIFARKR